MANEALVKAIKQLSKSLERQFGPLSLVMLYSGQDPPLSLWNLILSSPAMDQIDLAKTLKQVIGELRRTMPREHLRQIGRVTILKTSDPFIEAVTSLFAVQGGGTVDIINTTVADLLIPRAILFVSQKPRAKAPPYIKKNTSTSSASFPSGRLAAKP